MEETQKGEFVPGRFQVPGQGGELLDGYLLITTLKRWEMTVDTAEENRMKIRIVVYDHQPDSDFEYENSAVKGLTLEVKFGRKMMRGDDARIVQREPALIIEANVEVV